MQLGDNGSGRRIHSAFRKLLLTLLFTYRSIHFSASQRQFASYKLVRSADAGDDSEGHVTHVADTLSGSLLPSLAVSPAASAVDSESFAQLDGCMAPPLSLSLSLPPSHSTTGATVSVDLPYLRRC